MDIYIENRCQVPFSEEYEKMIETVAEETLASEDFTKCVEINVSIVDNDEIRQLNKQFRGIDKETDVLSFPLYMPHELKSLKDTDTAILGDIVISFERASLQAKEFGHGLARELGFLTAHSVLHLLGYDHMEPEEERRMCEKQERVLQRLGLRRCVSSYEK